MDRTAAFQAGRATSHPLRRRARSASGHPNAWPGTTLRLCRWHLQKNLSAKLTKAGYVETHEVTHKSETALDDLGSWRKFGAAAKRDGDLELLTWIDKHDDYLRTEFSAGVLPAHYSNGTVERALQQVKTSSGVAPSVCATQDERR